MRHRFLAVARLLLVCPAPIHGAETPRDQAGRPNILFALADDWPYGHAGAYRCRWAKTPAFDRVAEQGILFTPDPPGRACRDCAVQTVASP